MRGVLCSYVKSLYSRKVSLVALLLDYLVLSQCCLLSLNLVSRLDFNLEYLSLCCMCVYICESVHTNTWFHLNMKPRGISFFTKFGIFWSFPKKIFVVIGVIMSKLFFCV